MKKSAFAALVGRPSVGKSTLLNRLCGGKVAIVSPVPQTTRNAIRGIVNTDEGQIVFVDTPGRHISGKKLNKKLMETGERSAEDADIILYLLDAARAPGAEEKAAAAFIKSFAAKTLFAVNKVDAKDAAPELARQFVAEEFGEAAASGCVFISALKREGLDTLLQKLFAMAAEGEPFYPEEYYTDQEPPFRIAEIIREKAIRHLREELPHAIYVDIADTEFKGDEETGRTLWVRAFIVCERESQKGMIVGKDGALIKQIKKESLKDLREIFDWKIELDLRVKAQKDWRHNDALLRKLI